LFKSYIGEHMKMMISCLNRRR